ncbi:T9SS type A sorting domain-containing protein [Botryobacter ruber]|uniref:T9SS type A sorting domain-containing protein n=1 Tax=Botryobacter ruber TaxID=2171629 RepID=UPI0013E30C8C|nr:T9SS type A sorting domain-containing protein [Botryobacter ruber]
MRTTRGSSGFTFLLALCLAVLAQTHAQQVAFPGAEGAGKFTTGGRGTAAAPTTVFEVTSLDDTNTPGTLRYALTQPAAARTVVFRVCGTIHLTSRLNISRPNTTIAGQTAPGHGICIADHPVIINADNVIIRFVRFRLGDRYQDKGKVDGSGHDDALAAYGRKNIIVDHCSMSWSTDEAFSVYAGDSTTLQWNIISEPLNYSYHFEAGGTDYQQHGFGGIWGGRHVSFHHNLFAHCQGRNPRFDGSANLAPHTPGQENADFRNNVIYNWGGWTVDGGMGGNYNIVSNYYKYGPSTSTGTANGVPRRFQVVRPDRKTTAPELPYGKYYLAGNYVDGSVPVTRNNWLGAAMAGGTLADTVQAKVASEFELVPLPTQSAQDAYKAVLQHAGCILPARDLHDQRIVSDVVNRTGAIIDVQGGFPHGTPYEQTVGAWPALTCGPAPADADRDGMPDAWEISQGLNPNNAADRAHTAPNGYTHLENYLNGLAATVLSAAPETNTNLPLLAYPNPVGEKLTVSHPSAGQYATLTLFSFDGKRTGSFTCTPHSYQTVLEIDSLAKGNYLLLYTSPTTRLTYRILKQ